MHIIPCKNQYKVRFGTGRRFQGNGLFFQTFFFGGDLGGRQRCVVPGVKRKPNLEPSTGGFRENSKLFFLEVAVVFPSLAFAAMVTWLRYWSYSCGVT